MWRLIPSKFFGVPPRPYNEITSSMIYPYWQVWLDPYNSSRTYFSGTYNPLEIDENECPVFYAYGANKPIMFHPYGWLKDIKDNSDKGCIAKGYDAMHWVMHDKPDEFNEDLL